MAAYLAGRGEQVALIEQSSDMYGGTCINIGCIPTKTLVHQASIARHREMTSFDEQSLFYRRAMAEKERVTALLRDKNYHNLADNPHVTLYTGTGSFLAHDRVKVEKAHETVELQSSRIFIDTGAQTVIPAIPGVEGNPRVYTSTSMLRLTELPRQLVIIGGGYIGLEFASMYASFGSQVTVLESYPRLIGREDADIAQAVQAALEKRGVTFRLNARVTSVTHTHDSATVSWSDAATGSSHTLEAQAVLLATGRIPRTGELNLEAAGVEVDERGAIRVNDRLVTTNPRIRALGDVKGGLQFTYISLDDFRIVREDLYGEGSRTTADRTPVSYSVFIDPPLARIGLNEEEALARGLDVTVKRLPVAAIPRAKTLGENDGLLKAVVDNHSQQILGCTLFAPQAGEVINLVAAVIKMGLPYTFLRDFVFTHPSMSEALNDLFA